MKEKNKIQIFLMTIGMLFLVSALGLTVFNIYQDKRAGQETTNILHLLSKNVYAQIKEEREQKEIYLDREMPAAQIEANRYIGILEIPKINCYLPVMEEWSEENAKIAPCRYHGSIYQDNMIIAGHNYQSHFGKLRHIPIGAEVIFTDIEGHSFYYTVSSIETVSDTGYDKMISGKWDLTLFTCTYSGTKRDVIRGVKQKSFVE